MVKSSDHYNRQGSIYIDFSRVGTGAYKLCVQMSVNCMADTYKNLKFNGATFGQEIYFIRKG